MIKEMIIAENISKTFDREAKAVHAVKNVSLEVAKGERICIHGPSGAGKSTLLHILAGLDRPTSGRVEFYDNEIYGLSDRKRSVLRNKNFGFIFQFYHLLPELNVLENVVLPAMINGRESRRKIKNRAIALLERVGMDNRLKHKPSRLSGGEAQRTAIARALINSPDVLFCDEPTGNLDSEMSEDIYGIMRGISEERGMGVIVVSHQLVPEGFAHTEYGMRDGLLERASERQNVRIPVV
jgi:ABC-type lipoprotein export system ATPase subunit